MKRSELKSLIKECLLEILAEGIPGLMTSNEVFEEGAEKKSQRTAVISKPIQTSKPAVISKPAKDTTPEIITEIAKGIKIPGISATELFVDTFNRTYKQQSRAEANPSAGSSVIMQEIAEKEPSDIFGSDMIDTWSKAKFLYENSFCVISYVRRFKCQKQKR